MARLVSLSVRNYRSISGRIEITLPADAPLVLVGENNAGKSNIVSALQLLIGPMWAGNYEPDDNDFFAREPARTIEIVGRFADGALLGHRYRSVTWKYAKDDQPPVTYKGWPGNGYIKNDDKDTCTCVVLEADRNLRYQLGYSSKWTFLSRLMQKFHRSLRDNDEIRTELETAFGQIKASFKRLPEFDEFTTHLQKDFTQLVGSMTHRLDVDFEAYNPSNFFHALRLQASEHGNPRALEEMGTGEQQVLAMAFAHAFARAFHGGILLVIEEPEAHLHPLAQRWLAQQLSDMSADGLQIIITTHSPSFIEMMNLTGVALIRKENGATSVTQRTTAELVQHCLASGAPAARTTEDNILPFYAASASSVILEGFFAKLVVLVEGPTEALSLPVYLSKAGLETAREGISIIAVHGKGNLAKWYRLFTCYGIPCYVIFDNDNEDDGTGSKRRDALAATGLAADTGDAYLAEAAWKIENRVCVFGSDFETSLRAAFPAYAGLEAVAAEEGVDSKVFRARHVAEHLTIDDAAGWNKMRDLSAKLRALFPTQQEASPQPPNALAEIEIDDADVPF
jgi:putative ATP-dependent endonuclease of OLD family